jgi:hypothetical protein
VQGASRFVRCCADERWILNRDYDYAKGSRPHDKKRCIDELRSPIEEGIDVIYEFRPSIRGACSPAHMPEFGEFGDEKSCIV